MPGWVHRLASVALAIRPVAPQLLATGSALLATLLSFALSVLALRVVDADDRLWLYSVLRAKAST